MREINLHLKLAHGFWSQVPVPQNIEVLPDGPTHEDVTFELEEEVLEAQQSVGGRLAASHGFLFVTSTL